MKPARSPNDQCCNECMFWDDYGDGPFAKPREGACCRFPPVRNKKQDDDCTPAHELFSYPVTGGHWWCGEFSPAKKQPNV